MGGYSIKLFSKRLRSEVQSLTLKYTIFDKRYPFRVSSIKKLYPLCLLRENKSVRKEVFRSYSSNLGNYNKCEFANFLLFQWPKMIISVLVTWMIVDCNLAVRVVLSF